MGSIIIHRLFLGLSLWDDTIRYTHWQKVN